MNTLIQLVNNELESVNKNLSAINIKHSEANYFLQSFLTGTSKKVRTILASLYLQALGITPSQNSIKVMTIGEIIHNASLLHDDVIDDADIRRNKKTINKTLSPQIAILMGDYLLTIATQILTDINNQHITDIFLDCTKDMCNAEFKQYFLRGKNTDWEIYKEICKGKTASLFRTIFESCAIIEHIEQKEMIDFAEKFGILFQLKNDLNTISAQTDLKNKIYTPKDFLGIEKTTDLIDNYFSQVENLIADLPDSDYKKGLGVLLRLL